MESPNHSYVFDLDGVLFDTREAVYAAYSAAGVSMPNDAWGKPWREWLPKELGEDPEGNLEASSTVHATKNFLYPGFMHLVTPLSGLAAAWLAKENGADVEVITGASRKAIIELRAAFDRLWIPPVRFYECTGTMKHRILCDLPVGVYVDDDPSVTPPWGWRHVVYSPHMSPSEVLGWTQ